MLARKTDKIPKKNGGKKDVLNEIYRKNIKKEIKQEAVVLIDEAIAVAKYEKSQPPKHLHGWLDNYGRNDFDLWTVYLQEKNNTVWLATLNVANTANGEKILYDIDPIKEVEGPGKSGPTSTGAILSHSKWNVNTNSDRDSEAVSTRSILANALETVAQNDMEKALLYTAHRLTPIITLHRLFINRR